MESNELLIHPYLLPGVYEIKLTPHHDHRGTFTRIYDYYTFTQHGLERNWVQENHSFSKHKGTIRGLHFQFPPYSETKCIRVIRGAIWDVFVDLRKCSPTFGQWGAIELSEENHKMLYLPKGFGHGFCTLTDSCDVVYKVDNSYSPSHEGGIRWNDPTLCINWPLSKPIISAKDAGLPTLEEFIQQHQGIDLARSV